MQVVIFRAYLDESTEKGDAVFSVGGFAGKEEEWLVIEPLWISTLPKDIDYFHATDCFGGHNQFRGMDIPKRVALLDKLTDLIIAQKLYLVAGVIDVPAYAKVSPKLRENDFLGNKYAAPFGVPVQYACELMGTPAPDENVPLGKDNGDRCAFFVEETDYSASAQRALTNIKNSPELWWRWRIGNFTVGSKTGPTAIPLLQIGDLGAFLAAKKIAKAPDGRIPWTKYFDKLQSGRRISKIIHVDGSSISKLHNLHKELKQEQIEGKNYADDF